MQPLAVPEVLDPDRTLVDDRDPATIDHPERADALHGALGETCAYGQQLWHELDAIRRYLLDSLPPDPRSAGVTRLGAAPTGPDDSEGWQQWMAAYARVTSALAGPRGDSGFGYGEARKEAQLRRSAPVTKLHADHPEIGTLDVAQVPASAPSAPSAAAANGVLRALAFGAAAGLVLRITRPRRRTASRRG